MTRAHGGRPYQLYTHCGIEWAKIDGTFWRAKHPLSDGRGNPPPGWDNPFQNGTLVLITPGKARFDSPAGSVTFGAHLTQTAASDLLIALLCEQRDGCVAGTS